MREGRGREAETRKLGINRETLRRLDFVKHGYITNAQAATGSISDSCMSPHVCAQ